MKKKKTIGILFVIAGFILGFIANLLARHFLPGILPESAVSATGMLAFLLQVLISALAIIGGVFAFDIKND